MEDVSVAVLALLFAKMVIDDDSVIAQGVAGLPVWVVVGIPVAYGVARNAPRIAFTRDNALRPRGFDTLEMLERRFPIARRTPSFRFIWLCLVIAQDFCSLCTDTQTEEASLVQ